MEKKLFKRTIIDTSSFLFLIISLSKSSNRSPSSKKKKYKNVNIFFKGIIFQLYLSFATTVPNLMLVNLYAQNLTIQDQTEAIGKGLGLLFKVVLS